MEQNYIFVVGLPRTGTKLLRNVLEKSSQNIYVCPETHFLGGLVTSGVLKHIRKMGDLSVDANVYALIDYMYSDQLNQTYWKLLKQGNLGVDRADLLRKILESDRSDKAIFRVLMEVPTEAANATILGERTPSHLYHVQTLLTWFPNAKIVHTFRDPRAILASHLKKVQKTKVLSTDGGLLNKVIVQTPSLSVSAYITVAWLQAVRLHNRYAQRYPNSYFLSVFEELIEKPVQQIQKLCSFLDIEFEDKMLDPRMVDSSFEGVQEKAGFNRHTMDEWKTYLNPWLQHWITFCCQKHLKNFGYTR
jgi:hypothetical protein